MDVTSQAAPAAQANARASALQICQRMKSNERARAAWSDAPRWLKRVSLKAAGMSPDMCNRDIDDFAPAELALLRLAVKTLAIHSSRLGGVL